MRNLSHHHHLTQTYITNPITTISLISLINCILTQGSSNNPLISIKRNVQEYKRLPLSPLHHIQLLFPLKPFFHLLILTISALCGTVLSPLILIFPFFFFVRASAAAVQCGKALPTVCTDLGNTVAWESVCGAQHRRGVEMEECTVVGIGEETRGGHRGRRRSMAAEL